MPARRRPAASSRESRTSRPTAVRKAALAAVLALSAGTLATLSYGQAAPRGATATVAPRGTGAPAGTARPAAPAGGGGGAFEVGLDGLKDDKVLAKLDSLGQESLSAKLSKDLGFTEQQRAGTRVLGSLLELTNTPAEKLGNTRRIILVRQVVAGLDQVLPTLTNANDLMVYTAALIEKGIEPDINIMEYFGESSATQAQARPAVESATKLLDKVGTEAGTEARRLETEMAKVRGSAGDALADRWTKMENVRSTAKYVQNMIAYYLALATDGTKPDGMKQRAAIADKAIAYMTGNPPPGAPAGADAASTGEDLNNLDTPESGVMNVVHVRLGKLHMVKGDYAKARQYFDEAAKGEVKGHKIEPAITPDKQFEARFFRVLTDVMDKKPDDAAKGVDDLEKWVNDTFKDEKAAAGVKAAVLMARYRVGSAQADLAKDQKTKDALNIKASQLLTDLADKFPQFQSIITEQLVARLPETADLNAQTVPVLNALINRGDIERNKPEKDGPPDAKVLEKGKKAAEVLASGSKNNAGATPKMIENAALLVPLFAERQGDELAAANGYLKYATTFAAANRDRAGLAVDRAVMLAIKLNKERGTEAAVKKLYDSALQTAVGNPFRRVKLYYYYANLQRRNDQPYEAYKWYKVVPAGDPNEFDARFYTLSMAMDSIRAADKAQADPKLAQALKAVKPTLEKDLPDLIRNIREAAPAAVEKAKDANAANAIKNKLAGATLLGAQLDLDQKNAAGALTKLAKFDQEAAGLSNAAALSTEASKIRVVAYLNVKKLDDAKAEVEKLAKANPGETAPLVRSVLADLDKAFDAAEANKNTAEMQSLATAQADLTGYLVKWSSESADTKIKDLVPAYKMYDADTKRKAATLQTDEAKKREQLNAALAVYQQLLPTAAETLKPTLNLKVGLSYFALGDWKKANEFLGALVLEQKVGGPERTEVDAKANEVKVVDNDVFWEVQYKWAVTRLELAKVEPAADRAKAIKEAVITSLKRLYITNGARTGGDKWGQSFTELRTQLLGDWKPDAPPPATSPSTPPTPAAPAGPTSGPTTQPVAAG